ncbi:MAG TPA: LamG domain-containing protein, partial [Gemmataceae bacterium]|nr:LamG domain-containing protein [Gemmataceae bacterium]
QTYTVTANTVRRSGQADVTYDGAFALFVFEPTVGGNSTSIQGVAAGSLVKTINSDRDQVVIGSRAPNTGGSLQGILDTVEVTTNDPNARVSLLVDDSADTDMTARHVTFTKDSENQINMVGLAPLSNAIAWNLTPTSSVRVLGGPADETFFVRPILSETPLSIDGGGGVNALDYSNWTGPAGLAAWYKGDGNADDATGGPTGVAVGPVAYAPGPVGQAFHFNGVDTYVRAPQSADLEPAAVSVEAWVNATSGGINRYIVSKGASGLVAASYALYTGPSGGLKFYVFDGTTFVESSDAGPAVWDGHWHHVVGSYNGSTVRLYVDGAEVGTGTPANLRINYNLPDSNDLFIGTYNGLTGTHFNFDGLVDEPSVYDRALSAAEVGALFAGGKSALGQRAGSSGLAAWYKGEAGTGDAIGGPAGATVGGVAYAPGEVGQAFRFNGNDSQVRVPDSPALEPAVLTVELWVNSSQPGNQTYLLSKGASGDSFGSYALDTASGDGLFFDVFTSGGFFRSPAAPLQSVFDGQWHHVAGTFDGQVVRLYVDGAEQGAGTTLPGPASLAYNLPTHNDLLLGNYDNGGASNFNYHFAGLLDEVSVYSRALSATEIQGIVAAGGAGKSMAGPGVVVDLPLGTATGLDGGITRIRNVIGSAFDDILVGNGGNVLDGGGGRNLLIAGGSASTLIGGGDEDILIAGTTSYDRNLTALNNILALWSGAGSYAERAGRLVDDPGFAFSLNAGTVHSNGGGNKLTGKTGGATTKDLYFANIAAGDLFDANAADRFVAIP